MSHLESLKANYAKLIIKKGLNIQKGQRLCIRCPIERADFGRLCAKEAYDAGCKEVIMMWEDDETDRIKFLNADDSVFDCVNEWYI